MEDPLPLESTHEARALREAGRALGVGGPDARAHRAEFDAGLQGRTSTLVDWSARGEAAIAQAVRNVLGLPRSALDDGAALDRGALAEAEPVPRRGAPARGPRQADADAGPRELHLPEEAEPRRRQPGPAPPDDARPAARCSRPRSSPASRTSSSPRSWPRCPRRSTSSPAPAREAWVAIERLVDAGRRAGARALPLPNAFPIRFLESGELLHFHHKWVHRLCYTAQEEIWRASLEEVRQVRAVHPRIAAHLGPALHAAQGGRHHPVLPRGAALLRGAGLEPFARGVPAARSRVGPDVPGARCSPSSSSECWRFTRRW